MLFHLVYVSEATIQADNTVLKDIARSAEQHNTRNDITGLLLHSKGHYMQILEGQAGPVAALYSMICDDARHTNIECVFFGSTPERLYPNWSMGVFDLDSSSEYGVDTSAISQQLREVSPGAPERYWQVVLAFEEFRSQLEPPGNMNDAMHIARSADSDDEPSHTAGRDRTHLPTGSLLDPICRVRESESGSTRRLAGFSGDLRGRALRQMPFTEEQIVSALRQAETGVSVNDICRRMQISQQTFYQWKKAYGGSSAGIVGRQEQQQDEVRRLKELVADLCLDNARLLDALNKKP